MSSNQQALLMTGGAPLSPPVATCVADPYYDDTNDTLTKLLLHFDGANLATATTDSSSNPKIIGFANTAKLTTVVYEFGTASLALVETDNNFVSAANSTDFNVGSDDFSFEMYVRIQSTSTVTDRVIACRDQIGGTRGWLIYTEATTGKLGFACWHSTGGTLSLVQTSYNFRVTYIGAWVHVAGVRDGNNIYLYVDGVSIGAADITGKAIGDPSEPVIFGCGWGVGAVISGSAAYSYIDEVRFRVGDSTYPGGVTFTPPTAAFDIEGAHTVLSLHGEAIVDSSSEPKTLVNSGVTVSSAKSKFGTSALYFSGAPQIYTTNITDFIFGSSDFTLEAWVYPLATTAQRIIVRSSTGGLYPFSLAISSAGKFAFLCCDNSSVPVAISSTTSVVIDRWWYLMCVRSGSNFYLFVDGVLEGSATFAGTLIENAVPLSIGSYNGGPEPFFGYLDDLRITRGVARKVPGFDVQTAAFPDSAPDDPHFDDVVILLHGDGTNGSTTFTDSSQYNRTMAISAGSPAISTAQSKFGGASIYGGTGYVQLTTNSTGAEWAGDDWTWETWYRRAAGGDWHGFAYLNNSNIIILLRTAINGGTYQLFTTIGGFAGPTSTSSTVIGEWAHLAVSFKKTGASSGILRLFFNGVLEASTSANQPLSAIAGFSIGRTDSAGFSGLNGYIEDYRLTIGTCRYTGNFTPPTLTFCDSETASYTSETNGTEYPDGQQLTTAQGALTVADPWVKLSGIELTSSAGPMSPTLPNKTAALTGDALALGQGTVLTSNRTAALTGVTATTRSGTLFIPPYPDFTRVPTPTSFGITVRAEVLNSGAYIAQARLNLNADGSLSITVTTGTQIAATSYPAVWLYNSFPDGYNIPDVANAYKLLDIKNVLSGAGLAPFRNTKAMNNGTNMAAGGYWEVVFVVPNTSPTTSKTEIITTGPLTNNPRYGEFNYYGIFYFTITVVAP